MAMVHSYARFSDKSQAHGDSTRRQNEGLTKFLKDGGHTLSNLTMLDAGKSGYKGWGLLKKNLRKSAEC